MANSPPHMRVKTLDGLRHRRSRTTLKREQILGVNLIALLRIYG
jgi:hypothetical protein